MELAYFKRIKEMREDHDLTQRDMAKMLDMPQPQYWRYESGERDVPLDVLIRIADYFDVSTDYLLERSDVSGWNDVSDSPKAPRL